MRSKHLLLFFCISTTLIAATSSNKNYKSLEQIETREIEINSRLQQIQKELIQLQNDSISISNENYKNSGKYQQQLTLLKARAERSDQAVLDLEKQIEKLHEDSLKKQLEINKLIGNLDKEFQDKQLSLKILQSEINKVQLSNKKAVTSNENILQQKLQKFRIDSLRIDSLLQEKHTHLSELEKNHLNLQKDSIAEEKKLAEILVSYNDSKSQNRSQIEIAQKNVDKAKSNLDSTRLDSSSTVQKLNQQIKNNEKQIAENSVTLNKLNLEIKPLVTESDRLNASFLAARKKIESNRSPLQLAVKNAETALKQVKNDIQILRQLLEKIRIDSLIVKVQNELDEHIQQQALKKKGAKKMVSQKESELVDLMRQLDPYRKSSQILQKEAYLSGTLEQKRVNVEGQIQELIKSESELTSQLITAQNALIEFDKTNSDATVNTNPKALQVDSILKIKKISITNVTTKNDSLKSINSALKDSIQKVSSKASKEIQKKVKVYEMAKTELSEIQTINRKSASDSMLVTQESSQRKKQLRSDIVATNMQIQKINTDLLTYNTKLKSIMDSVSLLSQKLLLSKENANKETLKRDSTLSALKKQEAELNLQIEVLTKKKESSGSEQTKSIDRIKTALHQKDSLLLIQKKENTNVHSSLDSLQDIAATKNESINTKIMSIKNQEKIILKEQGTLQAELNQLGSQKEQLVAQQESERKSLELRLEAINQKINEYENLKEKLILDSLAYEKQKSNVSSRYTDSLKKFDSEMVSQKQNLNLLQEQIKKAKQDSLKTVQNVDLVMLPFRKKIRKVDSLIEIKEQEILQLKTQKEKIVADSVSEFKVQGEQIDGAENEISFRNETYLQKKKEYDLRLLKRKKLVSDSLMETQRVNTRPQNISLSFKKYDSQILLLNEQKSEIETKLGTFSQSVPPKAIKSQEKSVKTKEELNAQAQKLIEDIYVLIGENKNETALKKFNENRSIIRANVETEAFQMLLTTFKEIGFANVK